jgi:UDPglucose 6-dehydrogenase
MGISIKKICCIGAGYVGGPTMAVMSLKCPNLLINVVDVNQERIDAWNSTDLSKLPIFEPGLDDIVKKTRGKNLFFSTKIKESIENADMIFISVNTPTKTKGLGAGKASDLKWVEACAREVAKFAKGHSIVVEKSTLPVRTAEVIQNILSSYKRDSKEERKSFNVLSNPEFLAEGTAINDLLNPDRVLIGGDNEEAMFSLREIYKGWVSEEKILLTNIWSSELAKLTSNAFLAQRISSINSISAICEVTGADVREVSRAIGTDSRIGSKFLDSGPGFGGSCFKKDILNLVYLAEYFGLTEVADFWESVVKINNWNQKRISQIVVKKLFGTISNKKLVILGFAFKANTNDTRESAAINICKDLIDEGAYLMIYDPKVSPKQIENDLQIKQKNVFDNSTLNIQSGGWEFSENLELFENAHAVLILTEWEEFKNIKWEIVSKKMAKPAWIIDSRSIVNPIKVKEAGLKLWRLGDGSQNEEKTF